MYQAGRRKKNIASPGGEARLAAVRRKGQQVDHWVKKTTNPPPSKEWGGEG